MVCSEILQSFIIMVFREPTFTKGNTALMNKMNKKKSKAELKAAGMAGHSASKAETSKRSRALIYPGPLPVDMANWVPHER